MLIIRLFHSLAGTKDSCAVGLMIGNRKRRTVQDRFMYLPGLKLSPDSVLFRAGPEGMISRQMQAKKGLAKPKDRLCAGISLDQRGKLPVKTQDRHSFPKKIIPFKKLQQTAGTDTPGKTGIQRRITQQKIRVKSARGSISVNSGTPPHIGKPFPVKEERVIFHQQIGILFKPGSQIGFLFITIPQIPQRSVKLKRPAGIIIKGMSVTIPAVACIISQNSLRMLPHDISVCFIAFLI